MIVFVSAVILIVLTVILLEIEHNIEMKKIYKEYIRITKESIDSKPELTDQEKFKILHKLTDKLDFKMNRKKLNRQKKHIRVNTDWYLFSSQL